MPMVIEQVCQACHRRLPRDEHFSSRPVSRDPATGKVRRVYSRFCRACVQVHPELVTEMFAFDV
jgi:hypothetical protein